MLLCDIFQEKFMARSRSRSGFLFMFVILVLIGAVIYTFRDRFMVLFNTGYSSGKDFISKNIDKKDNKKNVKEKIEKLDKNDKGGEKDLQKEFDEIKDNINDIKDKLTQKESNNTEQKDVNKPETNPKTEKKSDKVVENKKETPKKIENKSELKERISKVYFNKVTKDEKQILVSVDRNVYYKNTPLTETINSLLKGPSQNEKNKEVITNIPGNTKLLSIYIKENIAFVNFSKEFEYNSYGKEAALAQIKQIVYTATEFPNIKSVQILIDGKVKKYMGGEGILIDKPYSRSDFS